MKAFYKYFFFVTDDVSSISGSESDSDEHASSETDVTSDQAFIVCDTDDTESYHVEGVGRRHPRVFLRNDDNELFSIYRAVLYSKKVSYHSWFSLKCVLR